MKILVLTICLLISTMGMTQITITDADFPAPNDTVMVSQSDETTLDLMTTGTDAVWDFSTVNISAQAIDTFHSVQDAGLLYQIIFNNSWDNPDHISDYYNDWGGGALGQLGQFGLNIQAPVQFTKVYPDSVINTGIGFEVQGTGIPGKSDTIDIQYMLPMAYGDSWTSNSYTNIDLNPTFDAIYRRYQWRNTIVDGWGEITTPFGTFDAVRVKSLVTSVDSFYLGALTFWTELPVPDQVEYQWFTNGQKIPIFEVITSDVGGNEVITSIRFKDKKRTFASSSEIHFNGSIYPVPANEIVKVSLIQETSRIDVFDVSGKLVKTIIPTGQQLQIDVQDWEKGMYVLKLFQDEGISSAKFIVE